MFYFPFFQSHTSNKPLNAISLQKCSLHMLIGHLIKKATRENASHWFDWYEILSGIWRTQRRDCISHNAHTSPLMLLMSRRGTKGVKWTPNGGMRSQIWASDVAGALRARACFSQKQMWAIFALQEKHIDTKLAKSKGNGRIGGEVRKVTLTACFLSGD